MLIYLILPASLLVMVPIPVGSGAIQVLVILLASITGNPGAFKMYCLNMDAETPPIFCPVGTGPTVEMSFPCCEEQAIYKLFLPFTGFFVFEHRVGFRAGV